ncbi:hypothetical protein [Streptomyces sp. NPDC101132]|uniref:hypothetical protein n=1 Tax=Streptomyces sp. NPDC101132 TaxID=3366110 RepID=UPI00382D1212
MTLVAVVVRIWQTTGSTAWTGTAGLALPAGPALGGLAPGGLGLGVCYLVDTLTFLAALAGAYRLPRMRPGDRPARPGVRGLLCLAAVAAVAAGTRELRGAPDGGRGPAVPAGS